MSVKDITIVTICFNEEKTIVRTIESALNQINVDFEYVIVDGGSTDSTINIVRTYSIDRIISEPDNGLYDAMNKGVREANGKWICFLNSGDVFTSNVALSQLLKVAQEGNLDVVFGNGRKINRIGSVFPEFADQNVHNLRNGPTYRHGCSITKTELLLKFPFEFENPKFGFALDYNHIVRLYCGQYKFKFADVFVQDYLADGVSNHLFKSLLYNYRIQVKNFGWSTRRVLRFFVKYVYVFLGFRKLARGFLMFLQNYVWDIFFDKLPVMMIRLLILKMLGLRTGGTIYVNRYFSFFQLNNIQIGEGSHINRYVFLDGRGGIKIGSNSSISHGVRILTGSHIVSSNNFAEIHKPVVIGDNVWIGAGASILPGVTLGNGCVIAAGSCVVKDVDPYEIVGGVPARKIGLRTSDLQYSCSWSTPFI